MKVNFAHLCDHAVVSLEGKLSIIGVFSQINVANVPTVWLGAWLVFEIELDYTEVGHPIEVRVACVDADGAQILEAKATMQTEGKAKIGDHPVVPQVLRLPPLRFNRAGAYDVNIFLDSAPSPKARVPFQVVLTATPPAPPIQGKPPLAEPPAGE
jgi:hypothetical protein